MALGERCILTALASAAWPLIASVTSPVSEVELKVKSGGMVWFYDHRVPCIQGITWRRLGLNADCITRFVNYPATGAGA